MNEPFDIERAESIGLLSLLFRQRKAKAVLRSSLHQTGPFQHTIYIYFAEKYTLRLFSQLLDKFGQLLDKFGSLLDNLGNFWTKLGHFGKKLGHFWSKLVEFFYSKIGSLSLFVPLVSLSSFH